MERMKIRNPKIKKWRGLLILALIGAIITCGHGNLSE